MSENSLKINLLLSAWKKYMPVVRILMKKSVEEIQALSMNRTDFERDAKRKSGYKFVIDFINGRADIIIAGSDILQAFISALMNDEIICSLLSKHNYTFTLNSKYQLEIKNNHTVPEAATTEPAEETMAQVSA